MSVAGVLLCAGRSRRFGADKLLAPLDGRPLVTYPARALAGSAARPLVAVVRNQEMAAALAAFPIDVVLNAQAERGLGSSLAAGVAALPPHTAGVLIVPGDMPRLTTALVDALLSAFVEADHRSIVFAATARGAQRNPVVFPRRLFPALAALDGEAGGKGLIAAEGGIALPVADEAILGDVDTPADLQRLTRDWPGPS